ncbi:hypothetical protein DZJ_21760 [Dickeya ananatis]
MVPQHIQRDGRDPAVVRAEMAAGRTHFRQAVGQYINTAVQANTGDHFGWVKLVGVTTHKVCHQVSGQRALRQRGDMQMCKKIHSVDAHSKKA